MPIRTGARRVNVESDGRCAVLCDRRHLPQLRKLGLDSLVAPSKASSALLAACVGYELEGKIGVTAEVVVGAPLTTAEMSGTAWYPPQRAPLSLPSGALMVGGAEMATSGEAEIGRPVTVRVPPGEYILTLHRVDGESWVGGRPPAGTAVDVIVLTPAGRRRPKAGSLFLPFPRRLRREAGPPRGAVAGDTFTGVVTSGGPHDLSVNLSRAHARALRLEAGDVIRLTAGRLDLTAFYTANETLDEYKRLYGREALKAQPGAAGAWHHPSDDEELVFGRVPREGSRPTYGGIAAAREARAGMPAVVRVVARGARRLRDRWHVAGSELVGAVVSAGRDENDELDLLCVTTLTEAALDSLGVRPGDPLVVAVGETERELRLFASEDEMFRGRLEFSRPGPRVAREMKGVLRRYMSSRGDKAAARRAREMERLRRASLPQPLPLAGWLAGTAGRRALEIRSMVTWGALAPSGTGPPLDFPLRKGMRVRLRKAPSSG